MKTFRITGNITTEASYPHTINIDLKVEAKNQTEAGDKVWGMFIKPVGSIWTIKETL